MVQARIDADRCLAQIDWSKRDIVLNVPGTGDRQVLGGMLQAVRQVWPQGRDMTLAFLDYPTNWNFPKSIPQGMETLRLVLAGIAAHAGAHRIMLFGQSQGSILIGEAMTDPAVRGVVSRAALFGHPIFSVHTFTDGHDPKVWEFSNPNDPIAQGVHGKVREWVESIGQVFEGDLAQGLPTLVHGLLQNIPQALWTGIWLARGSLFPEKWLKDPHGYDERYADGLRFIAGAPGGTIDAAAAAAMIASVQHPWTQPYLKESM